LLVVLDDKELIIYAYGASRRMGSGSLEESYNPSHAASLFSENVSLINAVEWLLQADYAVKSTVEESKDYFKNRYEKVKNMLTELLPDVENIRAKPITKTQSKPTIEFKTPYGWINMRGLGYQTLIAWMVVIVQSTPLDANIVLLKREGDQVIIHNNKDEEVIKGWRIDQVLTSDLFELPSARPPEYDQYLKRQQEILSKQQITPVDEQELEEIGKKIPSL